MKAPERREFKGICETEKRDGNKQIKKKNRYNKHIKEIQNMEL